MITTTTRAARADAREKGDAARGAILFHSPALGCVKCHGTHSRESSLGPDLSTWKRQVDDGHLIDSVHRPSVVIEPRYRSLQILTSDGQTFAGVVSAARHG